MPHSLPIDEGGESSAEAMFDTFAEKECTLM